jgi:transposase-like protein
MRGRRPVGPEYADQLPGSAIAKLRAKVILETIAGKVRLKEACRRLGISEQRFHQLREDMLTAGVNALESGHAGRPPRTRTPAEEQVVALEQQLQDQEIELRAAKAREEIALVMPEIKHPVPSGAGDEGDPQKKTPPSAPGGPKRRRRGRKKNT